MTFSGVFSSLLQVNAVSCSATVVDVVPDSPLVETMTGLVVSGTLLASITDSVALGMLCCSAGLGIDICICLCVSSAFSCCCFSVTMELMLGSDF